METERDQLKRDKDKLNEEYGEMYDACVSKDAHIENLENGMKKALAQQAEKNNELGYYKDLETDLRETNAKLTEQLKAEAQAHHFAKANNLANGSGNSHEHANVSKGLRKDLEDVNMRMAQVQGELEAQKQTCSEYITKTDVLRDQLEESNGIAAKYHEYHEFMETMLTKVANQNLTPNQYWKALENRQSNMGVETVLHRGKFFQEDRSQLELELFGDDDDPAQDGLDIKMDDSGDSGGAPLRTAADHLKLEIDEKEVKLRQLNLEIVEQRKKMDDLENNTTALNETIKQKDAEHKNQCEARDAKNASLRKQVKETKDALVQEQNTAQSLKSALDKSSPWRQEAEEKAKYASSQWTHFQAQATQAIGQRDELHRRLQAFANGPVSPHELNSVEEMKRVASERDELRQKVHILEKDVHNQMWKLKKAATERDELNETVETLNNKLSGLQTERKAVEVQREQNMQNTERSIAKERQTMADERQKTEEQARHYIALKEQEFEQQKEELQQRLSAKEEALQQDFSANLSAKKEALLQEQQEFEKQAMEVQAQQYIERSIANERQIMANERQTTEEQARHYIALKEQEFEQQKEELQQRFSAKLEALQQDFSANFSAEKEALLQDQQEFSAKKEALLQDQQEFSAKKEALLQDQQEFSAKKEALLQNQQEFSATKEAALLQERNAAFQEMEQVKRESKKHAITVNEKEEALLRERNAASEATRLKNESEKNLDTANAEKEVLLRERNAASEEATRLKSENEKHLEAASAEKDALQRKCNAALQETERVNSEREKHVAAANEELGKLKSVADKALRAKAAAVEEKEAQARLFKGLKSGAMDKDAMIANGRVSLLSMAGEKPKVDLRGKPELQLAGKAAEILDDENIQRKKELGVAREASKRVEADMQKRLDEADAQSREACAKKVHELDVEILGLQHERVRLQSQIAELQKAVQQADLKVNHHLKCGENAKKSTKEALETCSLVEQKANEDRRKYKQKAKAAEERAGKAEQRATAAEETADKAEKRAEELAGAIQGTTTDLPSEPHFVLAGAHRASVWKRSSPPFVLFMLLFVLLGLLIAGLTYLLTANFLERQTWLLANDSAAQLARRLLAARGGPGGMSKLWWQFWKVMENRLDFEQLKLFG